MSKLKDNDPRSHNVPTIEGYKDKRGEWRWRLRARNGKVLACSGEGYKRRQDMHHAIYSVFPHCDRDAWPYKEVK